MQNSNSISVILPVYNSEEYIKRTLDTIFMQSVLPMEIIIVDDGSKDGTVDVINAYKKNNEEAEKRILLIRQANQGAGAARNNCIRNAHGKWLMFLDSDDLWDKDKIAIILETILNNPDIEVVTHNEYEMKENQTEKKLVERSRNYDRNKNLFLQLYMGNFFSTSCMTIRKDIVEAAGMFDESLLSAQDYDLWIRVGMIANIIYLDEPLATYMIREGNITQNTYRRYLCEMRICRKYILDLEERFGEEKTKKIVRERILRIHKIEMYLAVKKFDLKSALKIGLSVLPQLLKRDQNI